MLAKKKSCELKGGLRYHLCRSKQLYELFIVTFYSKNIKTRTEKIYINFGIEATLKRKVRK